MVSSRVFRILAFAAAIICTADFLPMAAPRANALVGAGAGMSQAFDGRAIPAAYLTVESPRLALSLLTSGVQTTAYFHSVYSASFFWTWNAGELPLGSLRLGFGAGTFLQFRGFRNEATGSAPTRTDLGLGPAAQVQWLIAGPLFLSLEGTLGIRLWNFVGLNFQEMGSVSLGVRF
jgi:hypothetical protein